MGVLFSRFKRSKKSSKEILEGLESEIQKLSHRASLNTQHEKSFICYLLALSFVIYLVAAVIFYCYFIPTTWVDSINVLPLLLFPLIIYGVKRLLSMYFANMQQKYGTKLKELRDEKKRVLDNIMENEVYKIAVELLERFDPNNPALKKVQEPKREDLRQRKGHKDIDPQRPHPAYQIPPGTPHLLPIQVPTQTPRLPPPQTPRLPPSQTPRLPPPQTPHLPPNVSQPSTMPESYIPPGMCLGPAPGPPQPNPILPRDRSTFDKMVDYLVGDGPSNRYALICSQCCSHNGMALRDEYEYTAFRCAYCFALNPARKRKPLQPPSSQVLSPGPHEATPPNPTPPVTPSKVSKEVDHTTNQDVDHTSKQEADHTSKQKVDHTSKQEVDHTSNPESDHTSKQEVDHTSKQEQDKASLQQQPTELEPLADPHHTDCPTNEPPSNES